MAMRGGACGVNWRRPASRSRALRARRWLTSRAWQSSSRMQRTACLRLHVLSGLLEQLREADMRISSYDRQIRALAEASEPARRLMRVESIGPQTATALVATVGDPHVFKNGRGFAAWLGITPRQHSSGGKEQLGPITRQGDSYLRTLLVHGARSYLRVVDKKTDAKSDWARRLKQRRHVNVVAVALAAKHARIAWAILAHGTEYRPAGPQTAVA